MRRRDIRAKHRQELKNFESAMICVHLAQAQIDMWIKSTDIYTDKPYWRHWQSGAVSWEEPKLETYMPLGFEFPHPPAPLPEGVGPNTSSDSSGGDYEEEDEGEEEEEEGDGEASRGGTAATSRRPKTPAEKRMDSKLKGKGAKLTDTSRSRRRRRPRKLGREDGDKDEGSFQAGTIASNGEVNVWTSGQDDQDGDGGNEMNGGSMGASSSRSSGSGSDEESEDDEEGQGEEEKSDSERGSSSRDESAFASSAQAESQLQQQLRFQDSVDSLDDSRAAPLHVDIADYEAAASSTSQISFLTSQSLGSSANVGMDGDFQPRRWPLASPAKFALPTDGDAYAQAAPSPEPDKARASSEGSPHRIVSPTNRLGIPMRVGAGRLQKISESYSYGPDSLRAGQLNGRVGRPVFQVEVTETEEEKKRRIMKERTAAAASMHESTASLQSSLTEPKAGGSVKMSSGNAQELLDALNEDSDVGEQDRLAAIKAQLKARAKFEADRAKLALQPVKTESKDALHDAINRGGVVVNSARRTRSLFGATHTSSRGTAARGWPRACLTSASERRCQ
jgi:hypothetical protein